MHGPCLIQTIGPTQVGTLLSSGDVVKDEPPHWKFLKLSPASSQVFAAPL